MFACPQALAEGKAPCFQQKMGDFACRELHGQLSAIAIGMLGSLSGPD